MFRVWGFEFSSIDRVRGAECKVCVFVCRAQGVGFRVYGLGCRGWCVNCMVQGVGVCGAEDTVWGVCV